MDGINLCYGSHTHTRTAQHRTHTRTPCSRPCKTKSDGDIQKQSCIFFPATHTRGQRPNGPASPYRRQSLLSHLLLFILLTMLSFGCRNHGDAFHPVCACGCLRAWKDKLGCISKERRSKELSHTPGATQSFAQLAEWADLCRRCTANRLYPSLCVITRQAAPLSEPPTDIKVCP